MYSVHCVLTYFWLAFFWSLTRTGFFTLRSRFFSSVLVLFLDFRTFRFPYDDVYSVSPVYILPWDSSILSFDVSALVISLKPRERRLFIVQWLICVSRRSWDAWFYGTLFLRLHVCNSIYPWWIGLGRWIIVSAGRIVLHAHVETIMDCDLTTWKTRFILRLPLYGWGTRKILLQSSFAPHKREQ